VGDGRDVARATYNVQVTVRDRSGQPHPPEARASAAMRSGAETRMDRDLPALKHALTQARTLQDLSALSMPGLSYAEHALFGRHAYRYAALTFAAPVAAGSFCAAMGWAG
jgi:hypothetical protein